MADKILRELSVAELGAALADVEEYLRSRAARGILRGKRRCSAAWVACLTSTPWRAESPVYVLWSVTAPLASVTVATNSTAITRSRRLVC